MNLLRLTLLTLALLVGVSTHAQPAPGKIPPFRFLILVDSSSGMKRLDDITPTVVHDLVLDGVYGRMLPGDLYAVWTFDEEVDTSFTPPVIWQPSLARSQAQAIDQQIRRLKYQGKATLEAAVRKLNTIISQSDDLTIIILHDGSGVMFGTPFDLQVTAIYRQFQKDMLKNGRPFVTYFLARDKKMIGWAVEAAGGTPSLPIFPRKPRPGETSPTNTVAKATKPIAPVIKPEAEADPAPKKAPPASIIVKGPIKPASTNTNAPAAVAPKPTVQPRPEVKPAATPIPTPTPQPQTTTIEPPKPVNPPSTITASAPTPVPSPSPKQTLTEPVVAITASRPEDVVKPSDIVPVKPEPAKPAVAQAQQPAPPTTPKPEPAPAPTPTPAPAAAVAASKAVDSAAQLAQTAVVVPPASGPDWLKLGFGCLFLAGAILTAYFLMRRPTSAAHGSVISRSMDRDKGP